MISILQMKKPRLRESDSSIVDKTCCEGTEVVAVHCIREGDIGLVREDPQQPWYWDLKEEQARPGRMEMQDTQEALVALLSRAVYASNTSLIRKINKICRLVTIAPELVQLEVKTKTPNPHIPHILFPGCCLP